MTTSIASSTVSEYWGRAEKLAPPSDGSGRGADFWAVEVRPARSGQILRTVVVTRGGPEVSRSVCWARCRSWRRSPSSHLASADRRSTPEACPLDTALLHPGHGRDLVCNRIATPLRDPARRNPSTHGGPMQVLRPTPS